MTLAGTEGFIFLLLVTVTGKTLRMPAAASAMPVAFVGGAACLGDATEEDEEEDDDDEKVKRWWWCRR